ncbi:MAG TPA: hypothetical protein VMO76_12245 [Candidatus Udaeobacter sp.]|jgi:hypothetical protein|nr:hypothetical protein [Candidatus Udaeobacter sp.]
MKFTNRSTMLVFASLIFAMAAAVFGARVAAQDEGWRIIRADWGSKTQRVDVTSLLRDLISRGGNNGKIPINEVTMGGNPAPGKDKFLLILAKNRKNEQREFSINEHTYLETRPFDVRHDERDDRPPNYGDRDRDRDRDRDDGNNLRITLAYYGVQGRTVNVTDLLRGRMRDGMLNLVVTNSVLGGDPAVGSDKVLIVIYRYQGNETATAIREGNTLTLP